jgi:hypothetical protein
MKLIKPLILAASLMTAGLANAAGSIFVSEPGGDGFNIETAAFNGSSYTISKLTFDFTNTTTADSGFLVIDGSPLSITAPAGGTASFFGSGSVFGFNFTSFDTFDSFKFGWDPDSNLSGSYGATALDFIGAKVTAVTSGGTFTGTFAQVGATPDVSAALAPIPEPESYALALGGLLMVGALARRRSAKV